MLIQFLVLISGLACLWLGAELLVRNSSILGRSIGISPTVIGLTVVSIGTSLPEFVVSLMAAIQDTMGISIGNIVGSNIANIGLILGFSAILTTLKIKRRWVFKEVPAMIIFTIIFSIFGLIGQKLDRLDGLILVILLGLFLYYLWHSSSNELLGSTEFSREGFNEAKMSLKEKLLITFLAMVGIIILIGGSYATVSSAKHLAQALGVSDTVIALTLIAVGTSLPELATTIVGILRKETDIVVGNVIGSNIFNLLFIGGVVPVFRPIPIERELFNIEFPILIFLSILVLPLMRSRWNIHRAEGFLLLTIYIVFLVLTMNKS